ncbi:MAG: FkbM family methyltransferase [Ginsengibacter sp.]
MKSDELMFDQIFADKQYDIKVPIEPKIIFDLGSNVGYASILFANRFPEAKIFALEPEETNFEVAQKNVRPYPNITLVKGAVWNKPENIKVVDKGYGHAAFMIEQGEGEHPVRAYTIREIMQLAGVNNIDILKIDIEGSEKEVFENGPGDWLPVTKIMIVETHDRYKPGSSKAVFNAIAEYDFSMEISGENLIFYNNALVKIY